ncbi:hypothetical protein TNCV_2567841 [Trichonephila clavipes]|uniref:Uncharacterized protein n=1 Tax=Trichonephila clavipes TaxID=2585209 RepID=A0A8X6WLS8_TRICX|nr:hypothetical protein TNCV_2567841 [Trichonephila clavipes]
MVWYFLAIQVAVKIVLLLEVLSTSARKHLTDLRLSAPKDYFTVRELMTSPNDHEVLPEKVLKIEQCQRLSSKGNSSKARAKKVARFNETSPQAELRRLEQTESEAAHRAAETPEQSQARRRRRAEYLASQRAVETPEQSQARRLQHATYMASQRDTETIEAAESRKRAVAKRAQQRRLIFKKNTSPPGGATAYRFLHSSINCQVANLTLSPTFRYVSVESPL